MGQMTIYLDDQTIREIETAAGREHLSVSRWVKERVKKSLRSGWPPGYFERVVGSLKDSEIEIPPELPFSLDRPRPEL